MNGNDSESLSHATAASPATASSRPSAARLSLARGTAIVSSLTVVSRVLGFVRDLLVARIFGASPIADAFFVAFRIPNLLRSFVAEGAMTSAFVPVFTQELARSPDAARDALRSISGLLIAFTVFLTGVGMLFAEPLILLMAPGFGRDPAQFQLCVELTETMLPFIVCISLVALLNGALNSVGVFGAAAMAQVWMNVTLIVGALIAQTLAASAAAAVLAWSVLIGGMVQVATQLPALWKQGFRILPSRRIFSPAARHMLKLMGPALLGATVYQIGIFLNTIFASALAPGSVSFLFYADRLVQLPLGIFSIALASVLLPALSRAHSSGNSADMSQQLENALRFTGFVILPIACGLYFFAEPLTALVFQRGAFEISSTLSTALAVQAYAFGIWATSAHSMLMRAFIARKDTVTPMLIGAGSLVVVVVSSLMLMGAPTTETPSATLKLIAQIHSSLSQMHLTWSLGHVGLAAASSIGALCSLVAASLILSQRLKLRWGSLAQSTLKSLFASVGSTSLAWWIVAQIPQLARSALLSISCGAGLSVAFFILAALALKSPELRETTATLRSLLRRRAPH